MNRIERITELPDWDWSAHSAEEIRLSGEELVKQTDVVWKIGDVAVCGFMYYSFVQPPWLWFVLAKNISIGDLIDFRRLCSRIPQGTLTAIRVGYEKGVKFAKLYGFQETSQRTFSDGYEYILYRRK